jgi:acyl carrier protein
MKSNILKILNVIRPDNDFSSGDKFISQDMLDSLDIIRLVSALDAAYNISIDGTDIIPENFESLESITNLILKNGGII